MKTLLHPKLHPLRDYSFSAYETITTISNSNTTILIAPDMVRSLYFFGILPKVTIPMRKRFKIVRALFALDTNSLIFMAVENDKV